MRMRKSKFVIIGIFILIIIIVTCKLTHEKEEELVSPIPVTVEEVQVKDHVYRVGGAGILKRKNQIKLSFKTGGIVQRVLVEEGDQVNKDDILAQLDLSEIKSQVRIDDHIAALAAFLGPPHSSGDLTFNVS